MKRTLILLLAAIVTFSFLPSCDDDDEKQSGQEQTGPSEDNSIKILCIGNSFTEDAVGQYLWELFNAAGMGNTVIAYLYIGGSTLSDHYSHMENGDGAYDYIKIVNGVKSTTANQNMLHGLKDEAWDYITFQQSSANSGRYDTYSPYLPSLAEYALKNCSNKEVQLALYQTWAYPWDTTQTSFSQYYQSDQMYMYNAIVSAVNQAAAEAGIEIIIPVGTAIQNARNTWMGDTFNRDDRHLEYTYGRYTASCTWFETFSGVNVTTTTYAPSTVTDEVKDLVTHAAHFAVQQPFEVNPMTDWQERDISGLTPLTAPTPSSSFHTYGLATIDWTLSDEALAEQAIVSNSDTYSFILCDESGNVLREVDNFSSFNFAKYPDYRIIWGGLEPSTTYKLGIRREATVDTETYCRSEWAYTEVTTEAAPDKTGYLLYYDFENVPFGGGGPFYSYGFKFSGNANTDYSDPNSLTLTEPGDSYRNYIYAQRISTSSEFNQSFFDNYLPGITTADISNQTSYAFCVAAGYMKLGALGYPTWVSLPALTELTSTGVVLELDAMTYAEPSEDGDFMNPSNVEISQKVDYDHFTIDVADATIDEVETDSTEEAVISDDKHSVKLHTINVSEVMEKGGDEYVWTNFKIKISDMTTSTRIKLYTTLTNDGNSHRMWMDNIKISEAQD